MIGPRVRSLLPFGTLMAGILLMGAGIYREEVTMIFMKAVNVCFQCIGIG